MSRTTTKFQGWRLPPFGAIVAVWRIFQRSASETSSVLRRRMARCVCATSKKSISSPPPAGLLFRRSVFGKRVEIVVRHVNAHDAFQDLDDLRHVSDGEYHIVMEDHAALDHQRR